MRLLLLPDHQGVPDPQEGSCPSADQLGSHRPHYRYSANKYVSKLVRFVFTSKWINDKEPDRSKELYTSIKGLAAEVLRRNELHQYR